MRTFFPLALRASFNRIWGPRNSAATLLRPPGNRSSKRSALLSWTNSSSMTRLPSRPLLGFARRYAQPWLLHPATALEPIICTVTCGGRTRSSTLGIPQVSRKSRSNQAHSRLAQPSKDGTSIRSAGLTPNLNQPSCCLQATRHSSRAFAMSPDRPDPTRQRCVTSAISLANADFCPLFAVGYGNCDWPVAGLPDASGATLHRVVFRG